MSFDFGQFLKEDKGKKRKQEGFTLSEEVPSAKFSIKKGDQPNAHEPYRISKEFYKIDDSNSTISQYPKRKYYNKLKYRDLNKNELINIIKELLDILIENE